MNAYELESPERKLVMWYKVKELSRKGLRQAQICRETGLDKKTVRRYMGMPHEEFVSSPTYHRMYVKILDPYEDTVQRWLEAHNDLSSAQIHDWLKERYENLPEINPKTVFNFVRYIRAKYEIAKPKATASRQYAKVEETEYGEYAQVDFGECWMHYEDGRKVKVYFFVMVLCRSRKKYVWFSRSPFTAELAVYAHEKAFVYYGGKPKHVLYDQDAVFLHDENLGDYVLTKTFNAFVNQEHLDVIFCRKSDPESKGKVENAVKYIKYNFLRGRAFYDIARLNEEADHWLSRTANGLPHSATKLIPDEVFEEERAYLTPYTGTPSLPARQMMEYTVHKHNIISCKGNDYSVPLGTYKGQGTKVWASIKEDVLEIYDKESGKQIASYKIPKGKGHYVVNPEHRKVHHIQKDKLETEILEYCGFDNLALEWMINLKEDKPRYYGQNLRELAKGMYNFEASTLHLAFERSLNSGMYNAKDFIALCDRLGRRIPNRKLATSLKDMLPSAVTEMPEKTNISTYSKYFS